eukprot:SAG31_NODE_4556_length_3142_cov_1.901413_2_plen_124_part_00
MELVGSHVVGAEPPPKKFYFGTTDAAVHQFLEDMGPAASTVREVFFESTPKVTDEGLRALVAACPQLTLLKLVCCDSVTDEGLLAAVTACPQLMSLGVFDARGYRQVGKRRFFPLFFPLRLTR